jgi:hypothetical protein
VPDLGRRDHLAGEQGGRVPELRPRTEPGIDVDDRVLADERARAEGNVTGLDQPRPRAVAAEVRVLGDEAARANDQQVGTDRDVLREDGRAAADPGAERPQVQRVQRRPDEQVGHRIGGDYGLDQPEPEVAEAPGPNAAWLPPADEQPFDRDREHAEAEQGPAAECHQPQVGVKHAARPQDPGETGIKQQRAARDARGHRQQLEHAAEEIMRGTRRLPARLRRRIVRVVPPNGPRRCRAGRLRGHR